MLRLRNSGLDCQGYPKLTLWTTEEDLFQFKGERLHLVKERMSNFATAHNQEIKIQILQDYSRKKELGYRILISEIGCVYYGPHLSTDTLNSKTANGFDLN